MTWIYAMKTETDLPQLSIIVILGLKELHEQVANCMNLAALSQNKGGFLGLNVHIQTKAHDVKKSSAAKIWKKESWMKINAEKVTKINTHLHFL